VATLKSSYFQFMRIYYTTLSFQKVFTKLTWVTTGWLDPPDTVVVHSTETTRTYMKF
jgi:hypothetical protein